MPKVSGLLSLIGTGAAGRNLTRQWDGLIEYVPELGGCHQGTINVDLSVPVLILNPHKAVPPFEWQPGQVEGFGFLEIQFEWPMGADATRAWVYLAEHSMHRYNMKFLEVITAYIPALPRRDQPRDAANRLCQVHFSDSDVRGYII
jgi:hypothetical protein